MEKKNSPQNKTQNAVFESFVGLMVYIAFAAAFGSLTSDSTHYEPCSTSSSTYNWSFITYVFYVIAAVLSGVIIPVSTIILVKCSTESSCMLTFITIFLTILKMGVGVMALVCFGGLCHSYGEEEGCGQLNDLVLAYIIIVSIGLGMGCFIGCIAICCGAFLGGTLFLKMGLNKELENAAKNLQQEMQVVAAKNVEIKVENEAQRPFGDEVAENKA